MAQPFNIAPASVEAFRRLMPDLPDAPSTTPVVMPVGLTGSQVVWVDPEHVNEVEEAFAAYSRVLQYCK